MDDKDAVAQTIMRMTILLLALASGVVLFAVLGAVVGPVTDAEAAGQIDALRWVVFALPLIELPMAAQMWMIMGKRMEAADDREQRGRILQSRTLVIAALFEAPALLAGAVMLLLGPSWHVIPAFVVFLVGFAALMPTRRRVERALGGEDGRRVDPYH